MCSGTSLGALTNNGSVTLSGTYLSLQSAPVTTTPMPDGLITVELTIAPSDSPGPVTTAPRVVRVTLAPRGES